MTLIKKSVIGLGLILASPSWSNQLQQADVGPFTINSAATHVESFPYPTDVKTVTLSWKSSDGSVSFSLTDNGELVQANYNDGAEGSFVCSFISHPLRLDLPVRSYFSILREGGCSNASSARKAALRKEIRVAAPYFDAAFARFRAVSKQFIGPSVRRCIKYEFGNHGPVCSRFIGKRR